MTQNQLLTYGAVGFAAFAAWTIYKQRPRAPMTAQQQRDSALSGLLDQRNTQLGWGDASLALSTRQLQAVLPNAFGTYTLGGTS